MHRRRIPATILWGAWPLLACWGFTFLHPPVQCTNERCLLGTPRINTRGSVCSWPRPPSPPAWTITAAPLLPPSPPPHTHTHSIPHNRPQDFLPHGASRDIADLPLPAPFPQPPIPSGSSRLLSVHRTHTRLTPTRRPLPQLFLLRVRRFLLVTAGSYLSSGSPYPPPVNVPSRDEVLRHASRLFALCLASQDSLCLA